MGRINIEIPDDLHDTLRETSNETGVPIKHLVIKAIEEKYEEGDGVENSF